VVVFREAFSRDDLFIHPSVLSSIHGWHHIGKKTLAEINNPGALRMCCCLGKACPAPRGGHPQDFDINISNKSNKIFSGQGPHEYMRNVVYREVLEM
jgi:hypothetical protein